MHTATEAKRETLNIRIKPEVRDLIDRAAKSRGKNPPDYLLERRDSLIPLDERSFKGAFYTPLHVVDKAYNKLTETLGNHWQKDYIVWDMCCGMGGVVEADQQYKCINKLLDIQVFR